MPYHMKLVWSFLALTFLTAPVSAFQSAAENEHFKLMFGDIGITALLRSADAYDTNYIRAGGVLGDIQLRYQMEGGKWQNVSAGRMADRLVPQVLQDGIGRLVVCLDRYYLYHGDFNDHYSDLELDLLYRLEGNALYWIIRLRNLSGKPLTVGDLSIPLPFNTERRWDTEEMLTRRVYPHRFISANGSFLFWMRPNSAGPYLVMTPLAESPSFEPGSGFQPTKLEYFNETGVFIHSEVSRGEAEHMGGSWRQPSTQVTLSPASSSGSEVAYGFKFRWADGYEGVRDVLYEEGLFDVHMIPGMTVPEDLEAVFSLRTKHHIDAIVLEHPASTEIEYLGEKGTDTHVYRVRFSRLGENMLTVEYGQGRKMYLEFLVTEPLETLIKKRAAHLVARQQHRDPDLWYDGLFSDWDMRNRVLRGPDDTDGLKQYWMSCDDPGLCKAPYIAAKNAYYPDQREIEAVEYYIERFLWGKQQRSDQETHPYGIYGIPNWKVNRESGSGDRDGWVGHLWRLYDYPHIIMLYLNMYRVAKQNPQMTRYLDKDGYLERAFGTAKAYFTVPYETGGWSANSLGIMAEVVIADVIDALVLEGREEQADWLRKRWEEKIEIFINQKPNYFYAEYPFGPCAFESTQAFARYAVEAAGRPESSLDVTPADAASYMEEQIAANICLRGWIEPAYYLLGSSRPGSLFYMTHLGGWSVLDYALHYASEPEKFLRLGYASFLCGWGLMNTGTRESGFGYWYPGIQNDGAAGTGFNDMAVGERHGKLAPRGVWYYGGEADLGFGAALRTAASIVVDDPLFGLFAYGGRLVEKGENIEVIPRDGLRRRFHVILGEHRLSLELERDGWAEKMPIVFNRSFSTIRCFLENRAAEGHTTRLKLRGLPAGTYEILLDGLEIDSLGAEEGKRAFVTLPIESRVSSLVIRRNSR